MSSASTTRVGTPQGGTESATRVAEVLLMFVDEPVCRVTQIAEQLEMSKAVVHRILQSLTAHALLTYDQASRAYRRGPAMAALGARALADLDLRQMALPVLSELAQQTGETATVSGLVGLSRVYFDQVPSSNEIKMTVEIGRPFPLHAGASSRAILAFLRPVVRAQVLDTQMTALTGRTILERDVLTGILERTRVVGYAVSQGERQTGAGSVAAPLFNMVGEVVGAISVCGPAQRFDERVYGTLPPLVVAAARRVSEGLGWRGTSFPPLNDRSTEGAEHAVPDPGR